MFDKKIVTVWSGSFRFSLSSSSLFETRRLPSLVLSPPCLSFVPYSTQLLLPMRERCFDTGTGREPRAELPGLRRCSSRREGDPCEETSAGVLYVPSSPSARNSPSGLTRPPRFRSPVNLSPAISLSTPIMSPHARLFISRSHETSRSLFTSFLPLSL